MVPEHTLCLGDFRFPVIPDKGKLYAMISNATDQLLYWGMDLCCERATIELNGHRYEWKPNLGWECMRLAVRDWRNLEGVRYCPAEKSIWSALASMLRGAPSRRDVRPCIYLETHEPIDESDLTFVSRDGLQFRIDWKFLYKDQAGYFGADQMEFAGNVRSTIRFTSVGLWLKEVDTREKAKARLALDLDVSLFKEPVEGNKDHPYPSYTFTPLD
jgi:hypothetical protein